MAWAQGLPILRNLPDPRVPNSLYPGRVQTMVVVSEHFPAWQPHSHPSALILRLGSEQNWQTQGDRGKDSGQRVTSRSGPVRSCTV